MPVNLYDKLVQNKRKSLSKIEKEIKGQKTLMKISEDILNQEGIRDNDLMKRAGLGPAIENIEKVIEKHQAKKLRKENIVANKVLDSSRIFTIEDIEKVCINYRLRFLESTLFKGELHSCIVPELKDLERKLGKEAIDKGEFFIAAPAESFELREKANDPLMFFKLEEGIYYLVAKWGNDLSRWRLITSLPKRNEMFSIVNSLFIMLLVAFFFISENNGIREPAETGIELLYINIILIGYWLLLLTLLYWLHTNIIGDKSCEVWDKDYK
jgi:hypothetical protein